MSQPRPGDVYSYSIDNSDHIESVSDNWSDFARDNEAGPAVFAPAIIGHTVWEFFAGVETRYLYHELVTKVRKTGQTAHITIRCDSPDCRRTIDLKIIAQSQGSVSFENVFRLIQIRQPILLLQNSPRSGEQMVRICSFCKKIDLGGEHWVELEEGVQALELLQKTQPPQLTHGVCPVCYDRFLVEIDALDRIRPRG